MKRKLLLTLLALSTALSTTACSTETDSTRKENGVFFEDKVNNTQFLMTGDSNVWNVADTEFSNGNKVRVTFDTKGTADKTDDEIINIRRQYIPRVSNLYVLADDENGSHYILDLYQVESVQRPTETGAMFHFEDGTDYYLEWYK